MLSSTTLFLTFLLNWAVRYVLVININLLFCLMWQCYWPKCLLVPFVKCFVNCCYSCLSFVTYQFIICYRSICLRNDGVCVMHGQPLTYSFSATSVSCVYSQIVQGWLLLISLVIISYHWYTVLDDIVEYCFR